MGQHHQTRQAASAVSAETSRSQHQQQKLAETSIPNRNPPQNQHQSQKPASLAKAGRSKHPQQKTPAEPASKPEASIISQNWLTQASPTENPRRNSIKTRSQHH